MVVRLLLGYELDREVAGPLADSRRASERARAVALQRRTLVHEDLAHAKLVGDQLVVVLSVGDSGLQQLQDVARRGARRVLQDGAGLAHLLAADVVDHEARLARGAAHVLGARADGHVGRRLAAALRRAAAAAAGRGGATTTPARARLLVLGLGLAGCLGLLGLDLLLGVLLLDLLGLVRSGVGGRLGLGGLGDRLLSGLGGVGLRRVGLLRRAAAARLRLVLGALLLGGRLGGLLLRGRLGGLLAA